MKKQQGFSLEDVLLALFIAALISAAIFPVLANIANRYAENGNVLRSVDHVFFSMENALNDAWVVSTKKNSDNITLVKCRSAPNISVNNLISQYQLDKGSIKTLNNLSVSIESTKNIATNLRVSFVMPSIKDATLTNRYLSENGYASRINSKTVIVEKPIDFSENYNNDYQFLYFDGQTGCFNETIQ